VPIAAISGDPANLRVHDQRSIAAVAASLRRFGQQKPIVIGHDGVVIAGNGTFEAAKLLGWTHIAASRTDLKSTERVGFAIADNRTAEMSRWDDEALRTMAAERRADFGSECERQELISGATPASEAEGLDDVPALPDAATTKLGEIWELGTHRLMCGDSSVPAELDRLLAGQEIHLVNTDPPYNVKVEPRSNNAIKAGLSSFEVPYSDANDQQRADLKRHPEKGRATHAKLRAKDRPLMNDFVSEQEFDRLLPAWFGNIARVLKPGGSFYIWGGYANCANYPPVMKSHELYFSQAVIWHKMHPVLTRKDFMGDHEWCFYGWRLGGGHQFHGPNNVPDVWQVKKVNPQSMVHLTEKPVELAKRAIEYSSRPGDAVLDLFGGSGSTMMAAEITGRRAYSMELDPLYCDVIIDRWQKFTKRKAKRIQKGKA